MTGDLLSSIDARRNEPTSNSLNSNGRSSSVSSIPVQPIKNYEFIKAMIKEDILGEQNNNNNNTILSSSSGKSKYSNSSPNKSINFNPSSSDEIVDTDNNHHYPRNSNPSSQSLDHYNDNNRGKNRDTKENGKSFFFNTHSTGSPNPNNNGGKKSLSGNGGISLLKRIFYKLWPSKKTNLYGDGTQSKKNSRPMQSSQVSTLSSSFSGLNTLAQDVDSHQNHHNHVPPRVIIPSHEPSSNFSTSIPPSSSQFPNHPQISSPTISLSTHSTPSYSITRDIEYQITQSPISAPLLPHIGPYYIRKTIGYGSFSKVKIGQSMYNPLDKVALKMIPRVSLRESSALRQSVFLEIKILKLIQYLQHDSAQSLLKDSPLQNIVELKSILLSKHYLTLVLELVQGKELFAYVAEKERLDEYEAAYIFQQLIDTVEYLHGLGIIHRDLKLENVIIMLPAPSISPLDEDLEEEELSQSKVNTNECDGDNAREIRSPSNSNRKRRSFPKMKLVDFGLATLLLPPQVPFFGGQVSPVTSFSSSERMGEKDSLENVQTSASLLHRGLWEHDWQQFESLLMGDETTSLNQFSSPALPSASLSKSSTTKDLGLKGVSMTHTGASMGTTNFAQATPKWADATGIKELFPEWIGVNLPVATSLTILPYSSSPLSSPLVSPLPSPISSTGTKSVLLSTRCGSEEYAPPELLRGVPYAGQRSDIWSLGILLYAMVIGSLPFQQNEGSSRSSLLNNICKGILHWPSNVPISSEVKELINGMLRVSPSERWDLEKIKGSAWLRKFCPSTT